MMPAGGGRGSKDSLFFTGECAGCGFSMEHLPENSDGRRASAIRDWNRAVKNGSTGSRTQTHRSQHMDGLRKGPTAALQVARRDAVPPENRSGTPELLRSFLSSYGAMLDPPARELLSNAAAEIEGGEEAYTVLVSEIAILREKLKRTEEALRATIGLVPRGPLV